MPTPVNNQKMVIQVIEKVDDKDTVWPGSSSSTDHLNVWSELRGFSQGNDQDFSGSGSAGIKAATGRVSMNDFLIEKSVDVMSERIFHWCCTGASVDAVVIEVWEDLGVTTDDPRLVIVLDGGINFSHYKIDGSRYFGYATTDHTGVNLPALVSSGTTTAGGALSGSSSLKKDDGMTVTTKEFFKLWFTRMRIKVGAGTGMGWHAGENRPDVKAVPEPDTSTGVRIYTGAEGLVKQ